MRRESPETRSLPEPAAAGEPSSAAAEGELIAPARLARYVLLYRVGEGGMGVVYAAYDPELDRKIAVKILRSRGDAAQRLRLRREARALARLYHPNIVTVHDVGVDDETLFIAMEFVDGTTLGRWAGDDGRSWREVLGVFFAAGQGLAAAHRSGLVHQDFKPSNVMVASDGTVKLVDFGLAGSGRPGAGGTDDYLAPERRQGLPVDGRSDQFSFCVALHWALYGRLPEASRGGAAEPRSAAAVGRRRPPRWVATAIRRGLCQQPNDRFASMDELLAALSPQRERRRLWSAAAVGLLVAASVGGLIVRERWSAATGSCSDIEARLAGIWDRERQETIRKRFLDAGGAYAPEAFARLKSRLDRYAVEWVAMSRDTCAATEQRDSPSGRLLDLRRLCLEGRLSELRGLSDLLAVAEPDWIPASVEGAYRLRPVAVCTAGDRLEGLALGPLSRSDQERAAELQRRLEVLSMRETLELEVDHGEAKQLVAEAEELAYPPLEVRALRLLSDLQTISEPERVLDTLKRLLAAAVASGDRGLLASQLASMAEWLGYHLGRPQEADLWRRLAEAALGAGGSGGDEAEIEARISLGLNALADGEIEKALELYDRAFELSSMVWRDNPVRRAAIYNDLGILLMDTDGRRADAARLLERSLRLKQVALGAESPRLGPTLVNLGALEAMEGRYAIALEHARRAGEVLVAYGESDYRRAYALVLEGQILTVMDRPSTAIDLLEPVVAQLIGRLPAGHLLLGYGWLALGEAHFLELDLERADAAAIRASEALSGLADEHPLRLELALLEARLALAAGQAQKAAGAIEVLERRGGFLEPRSRLCLEVAEAEANLTLGLGAAARAAAEQALSEARPDADPALTAAARFAWARATADSDRAGARQSAEQALELLATAGSRSSRRLREQIADWLAAAPASAWRSEETGGYVSGPSR